LQTDLNFDITVKNKYGRKIIFSSDTAIGVTGPFEELDTENNSKASY
jgi:hypothetical protein